MITTINSITAKGISMLVNKTKNGAVSNKSVLLKYINLALMVLYDTNSSANDRKYEKKTYKLYKASKFLIKVVEDI